MKKSFTEWAMTPKEKLMMKIEYFEHFVGSLIRETESLDDMHSKGFSIVKLEKLLFFACTTNTILLDIFDNWYATPWGHVEADIRKYYKDNKGEFSYFTISRFGITLK